MNEQTIFLIFLVSALAVTLGLYFLKAKKQMQYKGDERWKLIQLNANNAANISNTVLIVLIVVLPLLIDIELALLRILLDELQFITVIGADFITGYASFLLLAHDDPAHFRRKIVAGFSLHRDVCLVVFIVIDLLVGGNSV